MTSVAAPKHPVTGILFAMVALAENGVLLHPADEVRWPSIVLEIAIALAFLSAAGGKDGGRLPPGTFGLTATASAILLTFDAFHPTASFVPIIYIAIVGCVGSGAVAVSRQVFSPAARIFFLLGMIGLSVVLAERIYPYLSSWPYAIAGEAGVATLFISGVLIFRGSATPAAA